ncbi:m-AAA protease-interacting protein 1, mitochondrial [Teleopsis dalmanni]|uniref:m-AAA protease-interacting protein 1, mitochondrial n=1 Tax=Teleopsis dalmanni TaxID=139649 RepID=UPI0018CD1B72|nr:m-AAA protease-interacting protein 1, mitochondrial [Teleopsis dalmanni]
MNQIRPVYRLSQNYLSYLDITKRAIITNNNLCTHASFNNLAGNKLGGFRYFSNFENPRQNEKSDEFKEKRVSFPRLSDFPTVMWPSFIKSFKNWILINLIIRPYFDTEFVMPDFVQGAKHAVQVISKYLSNGEFSALNNLVTTNVIEELEPIVKTLSISQRSELAVLEKDIYVSFPYEVGIIYEENNEKVKKWVEIVMIFHVLHGLTEMRRAGTEIPWNIGMFPEYQQKMFVCNYRFRKEFTAEAQSDWIVNAVNHFRPVDLIHSA